MHKFHCFLPLVQGYSACSSSSEVENYFFIDSFLPLFIFFQALTLSPQSFPASLVAPMVSILLQNMEPVDNLTWSCMATLSELGMGRGRRREREEGRRGEGGREEKGERRGKERGEWERAREEHRERGRGRGRRRGRGKRAGRMNIVLTVEVGN